MSHLTPEQKRRNMQANKSTGTLPEKCLARMLWRYGVRYRKNDPEIFGKPDLTLRRLKIAIFCDGDFWHGKDWELHKQDFKTNKKFWVSKIERNIERDKEVNIRLNNKGWTVLRFWESEIKTNPLDCLTTVIQAIRQRETVIMRTNKPIKNTRLSLDFGAESEDSAVVTHYLHNLGTPYSDTYLDQASKLLPEALKSEANNFLVAEGTSDKVQSAKSLFPELFDVPFPGPEKAKFTFIDLFAGIGGFRMALQNLGGRCVFSSEWDAKAKETYFLNYGEIPFGDITREETKQIIPKDFDILCAGFPCQAFSLAGKRLGFEETRGTLFFDVADIIDRRRPKAFFLENVKGLAIHDRGRTLKTILKVLREDLGYFVPDPEIVNAMNFGVPQHRERIYIVGFRKDMGVNEFSYPTPTDTGKVFADVMEEKEVSVKYYLSTQYISTLIAHKQRHQNKGNGFGYEIIPTDGVANAIVVGGMGRERNLVIDDRLTNFTPITNIKGEVNREGIRRMTPREWARLQGYPDDFIIGVSDAAAYKQFGNSVAVPAIQATAKEILNRLVFDYGTR